MKDLNIRIKQKFNEVIPFDEKGTTWAAFLNIFCLLYTSDAADE